MEIPAPQCRHRPRRTSHESTGMLSYGRDLGVAARAVRRRAHDRLAARDPPDHDVQERADQQAHAARNRRQGARSSAGDTTAGGRRRPRTPDLVPLVDPADGGIEGIGRAGAGCRPAGTASRPAGARARRKQRAGGGARRRGSRRTRPSGATPARTETSLTARAALRRCRRRHAETARWPGSPPRRPTPSDVRRAGAHEQVADERLGRPVVRAPPGPEEGRDRDGEQDPDDRDHHE